MTENEDSIKENLTLQNGVEVYLYHCKIVNEAVLKLSSSYISEHIPGEKPDIVNETELYAEYIQNFLGKFYLSMNMVFPKNLGKVNLYGIDLSPNSKLYIEFHYTKDGIKYVLDEKNIFSPQMKNLMSNTKKGGLLKVIPLPFPVVSELTPENGVYKYPFLRSEGKESTFEFPESYTTPQDLIKFFDRCPEGIRRVN